MERGNEVESLRGGAPSGLLTRLIEIVAVLHHCCAQAAHGCVLRDAVAMRDVHHNGDAFTLRREGYGLTMIAARRRDHAAHFPAPLSQSPEIHQRAADFERAERRAILMLDP